MSLKNYQHILDQTIEELQKNGELKTLLLHSCCAPCSSYCLTYLAKFFQIVVFYYNPNITKEEEYRKRVEEQKRLIKELNQMDGGSAPELSGMHRIGFVEGAYEPERFYEMAEGLEHAKEGGERCFLCYELRQRMAARYAKEHGFDFFSTTLSVSPHKNADKLNEIGLRISEEYGIRYLVSDFKKKGGYQKSIELSREYHLYRQNYCGCEYSKREREEQEKQRLCGHMDTNV